MHANRQNTAQKFQLMQDTWAPLFWAEIRVAAKKSLRIVHQHYWWVGNRRSSWFTGLRWGLHWMFWLNAAQDLWQVVFLPATGGDVGPNSISTNCGKTKFHALISQQYSISPIGSSSKVTLITPGFPLVFQPSPPQIVQPFPPTTPPPCSPPPAPLRNPPPASPRSSAVASWSPDQSSASQGNFWVKLWSCFNNY